MARKTFTIKRHGDGTVTFRSGRYVENIDIRYKGMLETYEAIKYAAISAHIVLNQDTLEEVLREAKGLKS